MAWSFFKATKHGNTGITVTISDGDETRPLYYGFPMFTGQTAAAFKASVRTEVRAQLNFLNQTTADTDVSDEYEDL